MSCPKYVALVRQVCNYRATDQLNIESWLADRGLCAEDIAKLFRQAEKTGEAPSTVPTLLLRSSTYEELEARGRLSFWLNVLIYAEQVRRIVALLDLCQAVVILGVCRSDASFALLHHEVDICATGRVRM